ncbi:replication protein A 14 kDa subunit-like [Clytia hemisphaerica]|uniref:Uncharacterized protein n=1 Tax=Clytia hemisphaerica TaxID=252671 RepID=A0A7M5X1U8_9CNID
MVSSKSYVNGSMLGDFVGQSVCVLAKITNVDDNMMQMQIQMPDGASVKVQLEEQLDEKITGHIQMIARVNRDRSLMCENLISFGAGEIDLDAFNSTIGVMQKYSNLFSSSEVDGMVH